MSCTAKTVCTAGLLCVLAQTAQADPLASVQERLRQEGERNAVLNLMEIGARGFEVGAHDQARSALDQALDRIESFYSNEEGARKARSLWHEEGRKDFRGEPYERVMAYYYRGLMYLQELDWGNARASFEGGMLQDAFAEEDQNRFDFALMAYLSAWASHREGNQEMKARALKELDALRKDYPPIAAGHNTLVVVETGTSPRKLGDGVGHYELVYRRGRQFKEERVTMTIDGGQPLRLFPMEDIFWQASSRGGRAVDRIVQGKASFRATNAGMGGVLADTASTLQVLQPLTDSSGLGAIAGTLGAIGAVQMFVASKVNAKADTRYWSSLPDAVHVFSLTAKPGQTVSLAFADKGDQPLPELARTVTIPDNGLLWVRSRPSLQQPPPK